MWGRVQAEVDAREGQKGLNPYDLLDLPRNQRNLMRKLLKEKVISLQDAAKELDQSESQAARTLGDLVDRTYLVEFDKKGEKHYKILLARKGGKDLPFNIWDDLTDKLNK
jgi:hypothetical protein